jgi:hypothetical protein
VNAPYGTYIVFGHELPPEVHLITDVGVRRFDDGCRVLELRECDGDKRAAHYVDTFKVAGAEAAIPAWNEDVLLVIVGHYDGPHTEQMKLVAASIINKGYYTTRPLDHGDGGKKAHLVPRRPITPAPGSATFAPAELAGARI